MLRSCTLVFVLVLLAAPAAANTGLTFSCYGDRGMNEDEAFSWTNPSNDGLPLYGTGTGNARTGITLMWQIKVHEQVRYHTTFFYIHAESSFGSGLPYFIGAHPYPITPPDSSDHHWEIAGNKYGTADSRDTGPSEGYGKDGTGPRVEVTKDDKWYTQAVYIDVEADNAKRARFYFDLPGTDDIDFIEVLSTTDYGNEGWPITPSENLIFGDNLWSQERMCSTFRGLKIWTRNLSEAEILAEWDGLDSDTTTGDIWYSNVNPTPDDISDKSGGGNDPSWVDVNYKPTLWTSPVAVPMFSGASIFGGSINAP